MTQEINNVNRSWKEIQEKRASNENKAVTRILASNPELDVKINGWRLFFWLDGRHQQMTISEICQKLGTTEALRRVRNMLEVRANI